MQSKITKLYSKSKQPSKSKYAAHILTFSKAQLSAFIGGLIDYALMLLLTEVFGIYYLYSLIAGGILGAIFNFIVNRYWSFRAREAKLWSQLFKFSVAVFISITFKTLGTYLLTEQLNIDYRYSRLLADAIVCFVVNYSLQKFWVFKS